MDWNKLKSFYEIAINKSISKASKKMNISQSALSRQIQDLEFDLKTSLFIRHQKGVRLTEQGENLFNTVNQISFSVSDFEKKLIDRKTKPVGKLTISTTIGFGSTWLTPRIQEFMELNPEIEVDLIFDDKELDLSTRQADIGIFMRRPKQLNYIQKKLIDINYHIYGSPKYLEKYGYPKTVNDLNKHKFISFGRGAPSPVYDPDWVLKLGMKDNKKRKPVMKVNSVMGLLLAVESGVGLAALPDYLVFQSRNLIKVVPKAEGPVTEAHFVYPQSMKNVARVQTFKNFLYSKISEWQF